MRLGVSWPIGPCALIDLIGVDVHVHASEALYDALARAADGAAGAARRDGRRAASSAARAARASTATSSVRPWA